MTGHSRGAAVCMAALLTAGAALAEKPELKFLKATELPGIGLRLNLMSNARETPPTPPKVYTYTITDRSGTRQEDLFAPADIWRRGQYVGHWTDRFGNSLSLAAVRTALPTGFPREHASRADYERALAAVTNAEWSSDRLAAWASDYLETPGLRAEPIFKRPSKFDALVALSGGGLPPGMLWAFRLNPSAAGQSRCPRHWFCVAVSLAPGVDQEKARTAVLADLLPSISFAGAGAPAAPLGASGAPGRSSGSTADATRSPEFLASRQAVVDGIRNLKDWWYVETKHYIILSNLKSRSSLLVRRLQTDLDSLHGFYERLLPPRSGISAVSQIRIFNTADEYDRYVGEDRAWTAGLWVPNTTELVVKPAEFGSNSQQRDQILRIIYHEAFHQYVFYALQRLTPAAWFNEGHAAFFDAVDISGSRFDIQEDPFKTQRIEALISAGHADVEPMLAMSYETFYARNEDILRDNYVMAWALVYYLRKGGPSENPPVYTNVVPRYVEALWATRDPDAATATAFDGIDLGKFNEDFRKFWKSSNKRSAARRLRLDGP